MCAFGVEVGILRRLHCYPLCVVKSEEQNYGRSAREDQQQSARESSSSAGAHDDRTISAAGAPLPPERRPEHSTELVRRSMGVIVNRTPPPPPGDIYAVFPRSNFGGNFARCIRQKVKCFM